MLRTAKARTQRGKRALAKKEPKLLEDAKAVTFLRGVKCSQQVLHAFRDLHAMSKPHGRLFSRKHEIRPFDDIVPLEQMASKSDCPLYVVGTHNKKRPNNMVFVRMFNNQVLDMVEFGLDAFKPLADFKGIEKHLLGSKPCISFHGDAFDQDVQFIQIKSLLLDFFRHADPTRVNLAGIDHAISFTVCDGKVVFRHYRIDLKKSGTRLPMSELAEIGPRMTLSVRRTQFAADDLMKASLKVPKVLKPKKKKNVDFSAMGDKLGRVHMESQDFSKMQTRKMKGLKRKRGKGDAAAADTGTTTTTTASAAEPTPAATEGAADAARIGTRKSSRRKVKA